MGKRKRAARWRRLQVAAVLAAVVGAVAGWKVGGWREKQRTEATMAQAANSLRLCADRIMQESGWRMLDEGSPLPTPIPSFPEPCPTFPPCPRLPAERPY